jgi:Flp pilus assembly protein TadD
LCLEDGQREAAVEELRRAVALQPDYTVAYESLGRALEAAGRPAEAIPVYIDGIAVAERNGDLTPQKIMEHRLKQLQGTR